MLPFAVFGARPGHEILGPMAVVILGGLVTATLYTLCVVPALYARLRRAASMVGCAWTTEDLGRRSTNPHGLNSTEQLRGGSRHESNTLSRWSH